MQTHLKVCPEAYRTILENLPTAVYLVDLNRRIAFWNDGCEAITGYRRHEVIGRYCADDLLMHCDDQCDRLCAVACPLFDTMHDGKTREVNLFLRHKDGQRVPVRVKAVPVRNELGAIIGACECFDERPVALPARPNVATPGDPRDALAQPLREFEASAVPFGILLLGIDDLKSLHAADGDIAISRIVSATEQTLVKNIGFGNEAGYRGNGEFVTILRGCSGADLLESARTLIRLCGLEAVPWWGDRVSVTLSAGGTVVRAGDTPELLLQRSEDALQQARERGNGEVIVV